MDEVRESVVGRLRITMGKKQKKTSINFVHGVSVDCWNSN